MTKDAKKAQKKAAKEAGEGFKDSFKDTVRSVKSAGKTLLNATGMRKKAKEKGESYVGGYILGEVMQTAAAAGKGLEGAKAAKKTKPKKSNGLVDAGSKGGLDTIIKNGKVSIDDIKTNPSAFSGKSAEEIADVLRNSGYDVTIKNSTRSRSGAQIIQINNSGGGKNISQVQVSPGGGRHGSNPYVKISTTDQGIIKIVDGIKSTYKTDGKETATIIFSGGN